LRLYNVRWVFSAFLSKGHFTSCNYGFNRHKQPTQKISIQLKIFFSLNCNSIAKKTFYFLAEHFNFYKILIQHQPNFSWENSVFLNKIDTISFYFNSSKRFFTKIFFGRIFFLHFKGLFFLLFLLLCCRFFGILGCFAIIDEKKINY